jgi:UDP-glucose 4-epimerase
VWAEFGLTLAELRGRSVSVRYERWRSGDQPCYISDIRKATRDMGWQPLVDKETGIRRLWDWVSDNPDLFGRSPEPAPAFAVPAQQEPG